MYSIGLQMNCENRLQVQGSTPLGSRQCGRWFSIKVRPLWGPGRGEYNPNSNGQWLIEPKFDQPFRFQNGFAEVIYYGQRRKINEKGEFVE
jgi:hypothetical protein